MIELRHWRTEDAEALGRAVAESLDHLRPWMPWAAGEPKSPEERAELIRTWERERIERGDEVIGIWLDGRPVGSTGFHRRIGPGGLEIGYWVHSDFTGRGFATEAVRQLVERAFADPEIDRVEIHHDRANLASGGVPRKLGFELVAEERHPPEAPGEEGVECIWRLSREAYEKG